MCQTQSPAPSHTAYCTGYHNSVHPQSLCGFLYITYVAESGAIFGFHRGVSDIGALSEFYAVSATNCHSQTSDEKLPEAPMPNRTTTYKYMKRYEENWMKLVL
jgi:hypothetical protein